MEARNELSGSHGKAVSPATYFSRCPAQRIISSFSRALSQKTSISLSFTWDTSVLSSCSFLIMLLSLGCMVHPVKSSAIS